MSRQGDDEPGPGRGKGGVGGEVEHVGNDPQHGAGPGADAVTEKGHQLANVHKAYDVADITQTTAYLVEQCSEADLDAFYRILEQYIGLLKAET